MKKILTILAAIAVLASCEKETFGPSSTDRTASPLENYMLAIADDIVATSLSELESALQVDVNGVVGKYFYTNNGISLSQDGSSWKINREGDMSGAVLEKVAGENAWTVSYDGELSVNNVPFPTTFTIKATKKDPAEEGHISWYVSFDGTRTEDDGYKCTFSNVETPVEYRVVDMTESWGAYGYLMMTVFKGSEQKDKVIMELRGLRSSASITHIN